MTRFTIRPDKTLLDTSTGKRFKAVGVTFLNYEFVSFEPRTDWTIRQIGLSTPPAGCSEPTYQTRTSWVSRAHIAAQLDRMREEGINLVRIGVEAAMANTPAFTDPINGVTYPGDLERLDVVLEETAARGMVCYLTGANDSVPPLTTRAFFRTLIARYAAFNHLWLNPANEVNCHAEGNPACNSVSTWLDYITFYLSDIRAQGFTGPVVINPPLWGYNVAGVANALRTHPVLANDPCLIVGPHIYQTTEAQFYGARQAEVEAGIGQYFDDFCMLIDEVGIDNFPGLYDPNLDSRPSLNPARFEQMKQWCREFLAWSRYYTDGWVLNGVIGTDWQSYLSGPAVYDDNTMTRLDGTATAWGGIFLSHANRYRPANNPQPVPTPEREPIGVEPMKQYRGARLFKDGANLKLVPHDGNRIAVDGRLCLVPTLTLAPTGLTANTLYHIYAHDTNGDGTLDGLEASTTAPVITTDLSGENLAVKTGDPTRAYVGIAFLTASGWQDDDKGRLVRSWFNRFPLPLRNAFTTLRSPSPTFPLTVIHPEIELRFVCFDGELLALNFNGTATLNQAGTTAMRLLLNGNQVGNLSEVTHAANAWCPHTLTHRQLMPSGVHTATVTGCSSGGTPAWNTYSMLSGVVG